MKSAALKGVVANGRSQRLSGGFTARPTAAYAQGWRHTIVAWLTLVGAVIPAAEVHVLLGNAKFTIGRLCIALLVPAAIIVFSRSGRKALPADYLACATSIWMVTAGALAGDSVSLSSSISEALEFGGGYLVARGFFFGPAAVQSFVRVLKILALTATVATLDAISKRSVIHDSFAALMRVAPFIDLYRGSILRVSYTFDHAIHFGLFSGVLANIFLYSERKVVARALWVIVALYGCILSWSSSGLLAVALALGLYGYGHVMKRFSWRWSALLQAMIAIGVAFFLLSNNPMGWLMSHLTLDAESGYIRFVEWDFATTKIAESPYTGFGLQSLDNGLLDMSVDCVWLVEALRFGLPAVVLLALTNLAAMLPVSRTRIPDQNYVSQLRTGFTVTLVMFMFVGFTAHLWNYIWIFWGICVGIRVSLSEYSISEIARFRSYARARDRMNSPI